MQHNDIILSLCYSAYSDQRPLIGGSTDTTPMQSFLSIPTEQNYRQVRYSKASIKPDEDKISESSDDHKPQISDMIQMSSTSPSDSNDDSPGPDNYASSNFNEPEIIAPGQPIRPIKSSTTAYPNNPFEVASSSGKCLFSWFLHSLE